MKFSKKNNNHKFNVGSTLKILLVIIIMSVSSNTHAQFLKKLGDVAEKAAKRTIERKVDEKTERETDKAFDSVFNNDAKSKKRKKKGKKSKKNSSKTIEESSEILIVNRNFDFTPGNRLIFTDNFSKDQIGDFPAKWDTNGSGGLVNISDQKWLRLSGNSVYIPMYPNKLPENYTIEFDLLTQGLDKGTSSEAYISLMLENTKNFQKAQTWSMVEISPCQFIGSRGVVEKQVNGKRQLRNQIGKDYRNTIKGKSKISIAVNKTRMRVWLNENKIIDIPRLIDNDAKYFKIATRRLRDAPNVDEVYITNFKIAESGVDNRSKLLTEGRLSTNAILFQSGSANLKSESNTVIDEISLVLQQNPEVSIQIIGHTDADGSESSNLELSKQRALSVKKVMTSRSGIDPSRISTDGKGESTPVASNNTNSGKAQNRRVEFIKL